MDLNNIETEIKDIRIKLCNNVQKNAGMSDEEQELKKENLDLINEICLKSLTMLSKLREDLKGGD